MRRLTALFFAAALAACNSSGDTAGPVVPGGDSPPDTPATRAAAAAESSPECVPAQPFYWEIGDAEGVLAQGQAGGLDYDESSSVLIASASKWVFGAYVLERFHGALALVTTAALTMTSGWVGFKTLKCRTSATVDDCLTDSETAFAANEAGHFHYDGGHFQKWASDNGLGAMTAGALTTEYETYLGADLGLAFASTSPAGGLRGTPKAYRAFLQRLLRGELVLGARLGDGAVCTRPGECPGAVASPAPANWHYAYGHWVEDDEAGDGAYSSPGLFGFYPWIDKAKTHYGLVARQSVAPGAYLASAYCGQAIRKAYFAPQP